MNPHPPSAPPGIADALRGRHLFITGATGFLGKVLVEKLLWAVPEIGGLSLLIRPRAGATADDRLASEILAAPLMARLRARHREGWSTWAASKIKTVAGDLAEDRFGLDEDAYRALCERVEGVVAAAATVTFDERLDRALALNARGALRPLELAREAGRVPLLHLSTCFVSGRREGTIAEQVFDERGVDGRDLDLDSALGALDAAAASLTAGGEESDRAWIGAGAKQADRLGFNDVYSLTKALGERLLARHRGDVPVAILRPAIVESAAAEPVPGWIEAVRVADPMLVAYGRGRTVEFPGRADAPLELIPVDHVIHATIAAFADLCTPSSSPSGAADGQIPVYQLGSGRNPISLGRFLALARQGFARTPLYGDDGEPIAVGEARFTAPERYRASLVARHRRVRTLARWLPGRRASRARLALGRAERTLDHLLHLLDVYRPYLDHGARYDDAATRKLWAALSAADREAFPFDVTSIDWPSYIAAVHVPGLVRFALKAESGAPVPVPDDEREARSEILVRAAEHAAAADSLFELFCATADAYPEAIALQTFRDGTWLRYTYGQAATTAANVAARLAAEHGIGRGDRVVLWASGRPEWVLATVAIHRLGAVTVPLDPQWPADEIVAATRLVDAGLILAAPSLAASLAAVDELDLPVVELSAPFIPEPGVPTISEAPEPIAEAADLASILFTSGTTVAPKAVPLTHANYLANIRDLVPPMKLTRERLLSVLPIHHVFEQMVGLWVPLAGGSTISYVAEIKPAEISWMMQTTRPTVLVAVPRLLELLHGGIQKSVEAGGPMLKAIFRILFALSRRKNGAEGHKLFSKVHRRFGGSLRRIATGGSALEPALGRSFQLMGFAVAEGYGMTETSPVLTVNPWDAIRLGSVGRPLPGVDVDLRPPTDAEAGAGLEEGAGEIWVRGANVMSGYYRNGAATAEVMDNGWLNTGDLGFFDDDGYLRLAGRTKDVIVTAAGKNVYPEEVEARYRDLPGVAELVVLGLPAEGGGERVVALAVLAADAEEDAIRAAVADRSREVPSYQQVAGVELWRGDLPKTTTLKVRRAVLRDAILAGERGNGTGPSAPPPPDDGQRTAGEAAVADALARLTRTRPDLLHAGDRLADLGVDSLTRVELVGELEARFGLRLDDAQAAGLERVEDLFALAR